MAEFLLTVFFVICWAVAVAFLFFGLDDLFIDLYYIVSAKYRARKRLKTRQFDEVPPKRIAVFIAAWQEAAVIGTMLETTVRLLNYPRDSYTIFVGTYVNDEATTERVKAVESHFANVHSVINQRPGPTNKADNLNAIFEGMRSYEKARGVRFEIILIQDSEDVIHPTSLKLFNYLMPQNDMVQLPVFPMVDERLGFFKRFISGTYADEFAENHIRQMVARESMNAFVPSAGVGTAFSRAALDALEENGEIFNPTNLTEDYEISLRLLRAGRKSRYFLETVERIDDQGRTRKEFISTREFFPNTFKEAVRQKSRWIYGISFQTPRQHESHKRTLAENFSLYRDIKLKYANLLLVPAYAVFAFAVAYSLMMFLAGVTQYRAIFPQGSLIWWVVVIDTVIALERQVIRYLSIREIYGAREAALSSLVPPLLPLRFVLANVVNFTATLKAWRKHIFGSAEQRKKWEKTVHRQYATDAFIAAHRRKLGDLLIEKEHVTASDLAAALRKHRDEDKRVGDVLMEKGLITENALTDALADLLHQPSLRLYPDITNPLLVTEVAEETARELKILPLLRIGEEIVVVMAPENFSDEARDRLELALGSKVAVVLGSNSEIETAIDNLYREPAGALRVVERLGEILTRSGKVSLSQLLKAFENQADSGKPLGQILVEHGIVDQITVDDAIFSQQVTPLKESTTLVSGEEDADNLEPSPDA
ncbi:MAG: glycosyl transferase family protein [Candidatus Aquicultorales bacterium]